MARSRRKTPKAGWTKAESDKQFKRQEHRRERKLVKAKLTQDKYEDIPHPKKFGSPWKGMKDGKGWFGNLYHTSLKYFRELMRK